MKACSYSKRTCSSIPRRLGSPAAVSGAPARSSSQLEPHFARMGRPVSCERIPATGSCSESGALKSVS